MAAMTVRWMVAWRDGWKEAHSVLLSADWSEYFAVGAKAVAKEGERAVQKVGVAAAWMAAWTAGYWAVSTVDYWAGSWAVRRARRQVAGTAASMVCEKAVSWVAGLAAC